MIFSLIFTFSSKTNLWNLEYLRNFLVLTELQNKYIFKQLNWVLI